MIPGVSTATEISLALSKRVSLLRVLVGITNRERVCDISCRHVALPIPGACELDALAYTYLRSIAQFSPSLVNRMAIVGAI